MSYSLFLIVLTLFESFDQSSIESVKIGNQVWMTKNLDTRFFLNGDPILEAKTMKEWKSAGRKHKPAWCYYNNIEKSGHKYGKLYNWYAVKDTRGLAPTGWHVANKADWLTLRNFVEGSLEVGAGRFLKSSSDWQENSDDKFGFHAMVGGYRTCKGEFAQMNEIGCWWTSTKLDGSSAYNFSMAKIPDDLTVGIDENCSAFSIRCVKD